MRNNDIFVYSGRIVLEFIQSILYFPLWWFTMGLLMIIQKNVIFIQDRQKSLSVLIWLKNIFKPMYGQTDLQGRLISFMVRVVQIIFRTIFLLFYIVVSFLVILLWIILPFLIFYEIIYQIYPDIALIFINVK